MKQHGSSNSVIYCPIRAINALSIHRIFDTRFVDDNPAMHGKYLPGLHNPVESFESLLDNPPACILIYSRTYATPIRDRCEAAPPLGHTAIFQISDFDE